ncbi:hypothetical protein LOZ33_001155 [Ophidiomyces ophidiicola]|nr:hypothetical protein LOZ33_001155 [Ophidiomyces ophidiicola]KAI2359069.1 hypothetical protein LOY95_001885 [Ophidiomyces ophidiicola]
MCCALHHPSEDRPAPPAASNALSGTLVSSLHRLKDVDNSDGGFFVFGDVSVRTEGRFRLKFNLFEMRRDEVVHIRSILSNPFQVVPPKAFPGMTESTFLSRSFADQGVKLRIRKEPRTLLLVEAQAARHEAHLANSRRKRQLPRPEDYPPTRYSERPSSAFADRPAPTVVTSMQPATPVQAYTPPDRDYAPYYAPTAKKPRTSLDLSLRGYYDGDGRYNGRPGDHQPSPIASNLLHESPPNAYTQASYHAPVHAASPAAYFDGQAAPTSHPVLPSQPEHPTNGNGYGHKYPA